MISTHLSLLTRLRTTEDSAAWSRFVRLYSPLVLKWIRNLGIESNQAEDLVQEVFLVLLHEIPTIAVKPPNSFRGWLRTITLNKCRDWFRQQKRLTNALVLDKIEKAVDDPNVLMSEQEYCAYLAQSALELMRQSFSEKTWRACYEHVVQGRSAIDVAEELGLTVNAVYLARGRVLSRLRTELDGLWETH